MISIDQEFSISKIPTTAYNDQKPGTSGLRKKTTVVQQPNYIENFMQSLLLSVRPDELSCYNVLVAGGDGRYHNLSALYTLIDIAAANGIDELHIGHQGLMSTPAISHQIRMINQVQGNCIGGVILTASHNPGGPTEDWGIKYNVRNGGPASEEFTNKTFSISQSIKEYKICKGVSKHIDLSCNNTVYTFSNMNRPWKPVFKVKVIDSTADYLSLLKTQFCFPKLQSFVSRDDFSMLFDGMSGIAGPYAQSVFVDALKISKECLMNCTVLEDFGGSHPDPNLTYAKELVTRMAIQNPFPQSSPPIFGAACDGDADRNMILGRHFFVTPSDSLAILVANHSCFLSTAIKGVARSMPTSAAVDQVANHLNLPLYEVPTGWKYFGNLMDHNLITICGEESFGTGSTHIREKDGLWAILAWLSILADKNIADQPLVDVKDVVIDHWKTYGRNYYSRYDYENVDTEQANQVMSHLKKQFDQWKTTSYGDYADTFNYQDPVDNTVSLDQGLRYILKDKSRIIFRLSGTGSQGATIRIYFEQYSKDDIYMETGQALNNIIQIGLELSQIEQFTGRNTPTVIT